MAYIPPKFIEIVSINFLMLLSYFLLLTGAALLLTLTGIYYYSRTRKNEPLPVKIFYDKVRIWVWFAGALIFLGIVAGIFKLPSSQLVTVRLVNPELTKEVTYIGNSETFRPEDLKINPYNKKHPLNNEQMKDETMMLFWNGSIETPFYNYYPGEYLFSFQAKGSIAKGVYSKIKVEFEIPDENHYLVIHKRIYIELTSRLREYRIPFNLKIGTVARARITFFNDIYFPKEKIGRDVWIKSVQIIAQK